MHRPANSERISIKARQEKRLHYPDDYTRLAIEATAALELEIAGVDLLETNEGPVVLEVNPSPGFEELESVTGIDIANAIIEFITAFAQQN